MTHIEEGVVHVAHEVAKVTKVRGLHRLLPNSVSARLGRQILTVQKHSPTILFAAGVIGVGATVVSACHATLKVEPVLEEMTLRKEKVKLARTEAPEKYSDKDAKRDLTIIYIQGSVKLIKLYGPAFILGVSSIAALTGSHRILSSRNAALTAAYTALDAGFKSYRHRVVAEVGEEKERKIWTDAQEDTILVEDRNGPKKQKVLVPGSNGGSPYARLFSRGNPNWNPTPLYNMLFLKGQQNILNDMLHARGHVSLNDAYDALGLDRTPAGQIVGWVKKSKGGVDGYIDFGIWTDRSMERIHDYMIGREEEILIDFNVDGPMYELI